MCTLQNWNHIEYTVLWPDFKFFLLTILYIFQGAEIFTHEIMRHCIVICYVDKPYIYIYFLANHLLQDL